MCGCGKGGMVGPDVVAMTVEEAQAAADARRAADAEDPAVQESLANAMANAGASS